MKNNNINDISNDPSSIDIEKLDFKKHEDSPWPSFNEASLFESTLAEQETELQVDRSMLIFVALSAISLSAQRLFDIEMPTQYRTISSLMSIVISNSGERKSSIYKPFFSGINDLQKQLFTEHKQHNSNYIAEYGVWKTTKSALESALKHKIKSQSNDQQTNEDNNLIAQLEKKLNSHLKAEPAKPVLRRIIYSDTTPSALVQGLNKSGKTAAILSDEAIDILEGHAIRDLGKFNSLWDGATLYTSRISTGDHLIDDARFTLFLMAQEGVINNFIESKGSKALDSGFFARLLFSKPPSHIDKFEFRIQNSKNSPKLTDFNKRTQDLLKCSIEHEDNNKEKHVLHFNTTAKNNWTNYANNIQKEMREGGVFEHHLEHAAKLMNNVTRVAGLIHFFENVEISENKNQEISDNENIAYELNNIGEIDSETLDFAYSICMKSSLHYMHHVAGIPPVVINAETLVAELYKMIKEAKNGSRFKPESFIGTYDGITYQIRSGETIDFNESDIRRSGSSRLRQKSNFYNAIDLLKQLGHLRDYGSNRHPHKKQFEFSDVLLDKYTEHNHPPKKNGNYILVRNLPLYSNQVYLDTDNPGGWKLEGFSKKSNMPKFQSMHKRKNYLVEPLN